MPDHITTHNFSVTTEQLQQLKGHNAFLVWFTGLSGSGKSTIANGVNQLLLEKKVHTCILDGDGVRSGLNAGLTFSPEDRRENIRRIAEVAHLMIKQAGIVVLGAFISPYEKDRQLVKEIVGEDRYIEIYINTPLTICEKRDVKGLYKKARAGEIKNFTGIDAPYEIPINPNLVINGARCSIEEASAMVVKSIENNLKINTNLT